MRKTLFVIACIAVLSLSACTGESKRPVATGKGGVRAINTISTAPAFLFLIEERSLAAVEYSSGSNRTPYDDFEYIFNFEAILPNTILQQRVASSTVKVETDREYTFLITGELAAPTIIVWDDELRIWEGNETTFLARFAHTAESLGPIDVYFAAPGTPPAAGQSVGTLAFGELLPGVDYEVGEFVYTVTSAGNPGDILFTSDNLSPTALAGFVITIFDGTANDPGPLAVRILNDAGGTTNLTDANALPTIRFLHASAALDPSDVYTDELLLDQILTNHVFRDATGDIELAAGVYTFTYTSVGNVGSILFEGVGTVFTASQLQLYVIGATDALTSFIRIPNRRSVESLVKFTFIHTAVNHPLVDLYVVDAGTDIEEQIPQFFRVTPTGTPVNANLSEGDLELYLTVAGEKTVIAGPVALTTTYGDVLEYLSYDNVDPATADLVSIPLP